jgi:energy-coupling factor transporter ATP-binding protein EcfA2
MNMRQHSPAEAKNVLIHELTIEGFRGFRKFELRNLARVNLLVGSNNCGKTSILEAIHLLVSDPDARVLWRALAHRNELSADEESVNSNGRQQADLRRLFHGHVLDPGKQLRIFAAEENSTMLLVAGCASDKPAGQPHLFMEWRKGTLDIPLTRTYGISSHLFEGSGGYFDPSVQHITVEFVRADGGEDLEDKFDEFVLRPEEEDVLGALRIIEPSIQRIAVSKETPGSPRGGFLVRSSSANDRIPIRSFGEGIWRMLGLSLALLRAKNGILLIDDIDTGLHYSVMEDMWRLVSETAKRLNIQVFATTHSRDCYESLAAVCGRNISKNSDVTIQRIERDRPVGVAYSEQAVVAAARRHIEVR